MQRARLISYPFFLTIAFFAVFGAAKNAQAATFTVTASISTVDGSTFCGGRACTSADTIIIAAGARGDLLFQNFNGNGSYIAIKNEVKNPSIPVTITVNRTVGYGILSIRNCKYIDLQGSNDPNLAYGIRVRAYGSTQENYKSGNVWVYGLSDHLKIGYIEIDQLNDTSTSGTGIQIQDSINLTSVNTISYVEIHHNYIHDTRYAGMYLGHNDAQADNLPYMNNFSIHDNLLENMGAYGITFKGSNSGTTNIYNNTVKVTGLVRDDLVGEFKQGIGTAYLYGASTIVNIYNNWIEKTKGNGVKVGNSGNTAPSINIHNNTIVGCGTGNETDYGHGIGLSTYVLCQVNVNDNIIIRPTRYGLFAGGSTIGNCNRNLIGGGLGERTYGGDGVWTEGTGADANVYHANVADFNFTRWTDDNDYSNDIFTLKSDVAPAAPTGLSVI